MEDYSQQVAEYLLQINAIKLNPSNPFTWASGWRSPIYCDNRKTLSHPEVRNEICRYFVEIIRDRYPTVELIAGVATGAIAHGMLVADRLDKPFVYVRSSAKGHGLENRVEGEVRPGQKAVVIEDLISTGGSSLAAVRALSDLSVEVLAMGAIFTYGFPVAEERFLQENLDVFTLSHYNVLLEAALKSGYIRNDDLATLREWRQDPANWPK